MLVLQLVTTLVCIQAREPPRLRFNSIGRKKRSLCRSAVPGQQSVDAKVVFSRISETKPCRHQEEEDHRMEVLSNAVIKPLLYRKSVALAVLAIAPVVLAAALGNLATMPNIDGWYSALAKPDFTPPNWLFAPIWTTLYCLMAYAFYRILHLRSETQGRTTAIIAFVSQLALNVLWSFAFFSAHNPLLGLFVIVPLEILIVASIVIFARLDRVAAICLWPYAAWVAIATLLNASIWLLNP